jgi:putative ABC transport system substrate-binding protein
MKKIFMCSMCLAFIISLALSNSAFAAGKTLRIAMLLWRGETKAEQGFKDGLKDLGYSVEYTMLNAKQDREEMRRILNSEIAPKLNDLDYIYTFGTTVSKMTKISIQDRVPQLFNIVTGPVESGIVQSMQKTGGNIGGVTHRIPVSVQIAAAFNIIPFKRLGLLFNPREKNSMIQREKLYQIAKEFYFEVVDLRSPPALDTLKKNLQKLIDKSVVVDAVYLPSDSFLISKAKLIGAQLRVAKVKSIGSIKAFIDNGALIGVVPDYYEMGRAVTTIVDRHQKGEMLQDIPVYQGYRTKEPILMINKTTSDILDFNIPEALLKKAVIVN